MTDFNKQDMTSIWADTGDKVAPTSAKTLSGWGVETVPRQWLNWIENRQDNNIAYMLQKGIPEWDATTQYISNKSYVQRNNVVYKAIQTTINADPATTPASWIVAFTTSTAYLEAVKNLEVTAQSIPAFSAGGIAIALGYSALGTQLLATTDAASARVLIDAQQANVALTALSQTSPSTNTFPFFTGSSTASTSPVTATGRNVLAASSYSGIVSLLGLDQVTNTSDANKPVSVAQQAALNLKANASIQVQAGAGMAGGGALTGNVPLSVAPAMIPATAQLLNQSLDNYQTPGFYFQQADANALVSLNYPAPNSGTLVVTAAAGIIQEYTCYGPSRRKFVRSLYGGTWYPWIETWTTGNLLNIGTSAASARSVLGLTYPATAATTGSGNVVLSVSPGLDGVPTAPTAAIGTGNSQIATTLFVQQNASANPPGTILAFAGPTVPSGYLLANGASLSRTTYANLYAAIGTYYGSADSSTFSLPDLRGEFLRGLDNGRGVDASRGLGTFQASQLGSHDHTFTGSALPVHTHTATAATAGAHTHTVYSSGSNTSYGYQGTGSGPGIYNPTSSAGAHTHDITVNAASAGTPTGTISATGGTSNSSETRPRNVAVQFLIKY